MAVGSKPDSELKDALDKAGVAYHTAGDVNKVGQIVHAVREAFDIAMGI